MFGRSFRSKLSKKSVVGQDKKATYKGTRAKGCIFGPENFQDAEPKSDSVDCHRKPNSGNQHKHRNEYSTLENHDAV